MTSGQKATLAVVTVGLFGAVYAMRPESDEERAYYAQQRAAARRNPPASLISDWWE